MSVTIKSISTILCALVLAGSISACSSTLAPEDDATTEYVFEQSSSDVVLAKDETGTSRTDREE